MTLMDILWRFFQILARALGRRVERERIEYDVTVDDAPKYRVTIYQSLDLTDRRGHAPEQSVAHTLAAAFDAAGVGYRIDAGSTPVTLPIDEQAYSDQIAFWWADNSPPLSDVDALLLLFDAPGGGGRPRGSNTAIMGCRLIDEVIDGPATCRLKACRNVRGALHEVGHCLGGHHDTPILEDWPALRYHENMEDVLHG